VIRNRPQHLAEIASLFTKRLDYENACCAVAVVTSNQESAAPTSSKLHPDQAVGAENDP